MTLKRNLIILVSFFNYGCTSLAERDYGSALIEEMTPEAKKEIEQVLSAASKRTISGLSENIFMTDSVVVLEKNRPQDSKIRSIRIMTKPDRYELILNKTDNVSLGMTKQIVVFKAKNAAMKSRKIFLFLCRLFVLSHSMAEKLPANFNTQDKSLEQIIKFPDIKGDISTTINCSGVVQKIKIKF